MLMRVCLKRVGSSRKGGSVPSIRNDRWTPAFCASGAMMRRQASPISSSDTHSARSVMPPASIFDRSRISLRMSFRCTPEARMSCTYSSCLTASEPYRPAIIISENPMIALRGVRSSWLILARKADLARSAALARSRAATSSTVWVSSRSCPRLPRSMARPSCTPACRHQVEQDGIGRPGLAAVKLHHRDHFRAPQDTGKATP